MAFICPPAGHLASLVADLSEFCATSRIDTLPSSERAKALTKALRITLTTVSRRSGIRVLDRPAEGNAGGHLFCVLVLEDFGGEVDDAFPEPLERILLGLLAAVDVDVLHDRLGIAAELPSAAASSV